MTEEETNEIAELRERLEKAVIEHQLTVADCAEGLCSVDDVASTLAAVADAQTDLEAALLPTM